MCIAIIAIQVRDAHEHFIDFIGLGRVPDLFQSKNKHLQLVGGLNPSEKYERQLG